MASPHGSTVKDSSKMKAKAQMAQHGQVWSSSIKKHNYDEYSRDWFHVKPIFVDDENGHHHSFRYKIS